MDVLYGWNADDMSAFLPGGGSGDSGAGSGEVAEETRRIYALPLARLGERLRRAGARVHTYRLDWRPAGSPFGATHCVELPLLLGSRQAWRGAPMLGDLPWEDVAALGTAVRAVWISFARTGDPGPGPAPLNLEGPGGQ